MTEEIAVDEKDIMTVTRMESSAPIWPKKSENRLWSKYHPTFTGTGCETFRSSHPVYYALFRGSGAAGSAKRFKFRI